MEVTDIKTRIRQAARELVLQYSIRSVSMDDIAASLGMSKKTIYLHFKDKEELINSLVTDILKKSRSCCETDSHRAENAIHEIFLAMGMHADLFRTMNPGILFDMQKYHPKVFAQFVGFRNEYLGQLIKHNLHRGIKEGFYREDINIEVLTKLRIENIFLPFNPDFRKGLNESIFDLHEEIIIHFLFGIVSEKGYSLTLKYLQQHKKDNPEKK